MHIYIVQQIEYKDFNLRFQGVGILHIVVTLHKVVK